MVSDDNERERHVLVVDDRYQEEDLAARIQGALDGSGYTWRITSEIDGQRALNRIANETQNIDAVLLDLEMSDQPKQGEALLAEFKTIDASLPVVILSGKEKSAQKIQAVLHQGAIFYSDKKDLGTENDHLRVVLDATQGHPEEREFQLRMCALALPHDDELRAARRLLERGLNALVTQSIDEFESECEVVGISSVAKGMSEVRAQLLLGGAALAACQVGDMILGYRSKQARGQNSARYEELKETISNRAERLGDRQARGRRLAARTVQILTLQEMKLLRPDAASVLVTLGAFRDLIASPRLDRSVDSRADAIFLMDLALTILELEGTDEGDEHRGNAATVRYLVRALDQQVEDLSSRYRRWQESRSASPLTAPVPMPQEEKVRVLPSAVIHEPVRACREALDIIRAIRCEIAVQLQALGAAIPASWDPRYDGSEKALQVLHTAARQAMGKKFPPGVWGRSEKFFIGYGLPIERLCGAPRQGDTVPSWQARLAARACLAVYDWWVSEYLPWCEEVKWDEVVQPRMIPQKA